MLFIDEECPTKRMIQSTDIKEMESEECAASACGQVSTSLPHSSGWVKMGDLCNSGKVNACQRVGGLG